MLSIHLRRTGAKKDPHYRVVVTDSRVARDGAFIEVLGHYHPRYEPAKVVLDVQKTRSWIEKGAQPSDTVRSLLKKVESGSIAVEQPVSPSRQRDVVKQAEIRANAPSPKADEAEEAPAEAAADDVEEAPVEEAPEAASDEPEAAPEAASDDAEAAPEEETEGDKAEVASETEAPAEEEVAAPEPEVGAEEEAADAAGEAEEASEAADEEEEKE